MNSSFNEENTGKGSGNGNDNGERGAGRVYNLKPAVPRADYVPREESEANDRGRGSKKNRTGRGSNQKPGSFIRFCVRAKFLALIVSIIGVVLFLICFGYGISMMFRIPAAISVPLVNGDLYPVNEKEKDLEDYQNAVNGGISSSKAEAVLNHLEKHPEDESKLTDQLPEGIADILGGVKLSKKNLLESYTLFKEITSNAALVEKYPSRPDMFMLYGSWFGETGLTGYNDENNEHGLFNAIDFKLGNSSSFIGPFQINRKYLENTPANGGLSKQFYITKKESKSLEDGERFGSYGEVNKSHISFKKGERLNSVNLFFPDITYWTWKSWIETTGRGDISSLFDKLCAKYGIDEAGRQYLNDIIAIQAHAGLYFASFDPLGANSPGINKETGEIINPNTNWLLAFHTDIAKSGLYKEFTRCTSPNRNDFVEFVYTGSNSIARKLEGKKLFNVNYANKTAYDVFYDQGIASVNPDAHTVAVTRYTWGKLIVSQIETYADIWFNDLGLSMDRVPGAGNGVFIETAGSGQGQWLVNGNLVSIEDWIKTSKVSNSEIQWVKKFAPYFGTIGHASGCANAKDMSAWQASGWGVPFYPQTMCKCGCYMQLAYNNYGDYFGTTACPWYMTAYMVSALKGSLINPPEIMAACILNGGLPDSHYFASSVVSQTVAKLGIDFSAVKVGSSAEKKKLVDKTLSMGGIVGSVAGSGGSSLKGEGKFILNTTSYETHFFVITGKTGDSYNAKYYIYSSTSVKQTVDKTFTWEELAQNLVGSGHSCGTLYLATNK